MARRHAYTEEELAPALVLLKDGAGYREASRSTGISRSSLRRHLPGYAMPAHESGALSRVTMLVYGSRGARNAG